MADQQKRATVMLLHGDSENRLRQAIAQGLVSKEVQQDIEEALTCAEEARVYAESMQAQVEKERQMVDYLQRKEKSDAEYYAKAVAAYKREEKRMRDNSDRKEVFIIAVLGAVAFITANVVGRLVFGILFK